MARGTTSTIDKAAKQAEKISPTQLQASLDAKKSIPAAVTQFVVAVLAAGIRARASAIHIESHAEGLRIRHRIDGVLTDTDNLPPGAGPILIAGFKVLVHLSIEEQELPQQAATTVTVQDKPYKLRVSTIAIEGGEKAVVQLTSLGDRAPTLQELGCWGPNLNALSTAMGATKGLVLLAGPHDAGQAETAYSLLSQLSVSGVSIATIEDPILYRITGATQMQVNVRIGLGVAAGLRALLTQDANVVLVSNVHDGKTAGLVVEGALAGRLLIAGLHASSATAALGYLLAMGIEPYLVAHAVEAIVGQRMVRRLCDNCKQLFRPTEPDMISLLKSLGIKTAAQLERVQQLKRQAIQEKLVVGASPASDSPAITTLYRPAENGCNECTHTGHKGTVGIYEVMPVSEALQHLMVSNASPRVIEDQAMQEGMPTMQMDGLVKVLLGLTSADEVVSATQF